ncbi:MAG: alpha/beta fold hydrolase [Spirulinaceae cyanobacterium RM2_2_10]|nr:alpha/beta fold hydrolase [Spirulinaceae cyanobacterium SM2_1_0]NJO21238.1 alpha/beta fold hydrolase [Spirulinaceae cyanobacterium RM2_2_10]
MTVTPVLSLDTAPQYWQWGDHEICYQQCGEQGPAVVLIHGFGASWGHWRKNIPVLGQAARCYALDLLGFGGSAKPAPQPDLYSFATWAAQIEAFCHEVIGEPAFLVGNSIGCIAALQAAVSTPAQVRGVAALNISLRQLHERKRAALPWHEQMSAPLLQQLLKQRWFGSRFFRLLARPHFVRRALQQAYGDPATVTDELVAMLLKPAADVGAADVFVAFTTYSQGPLAEDLLPQVRCPVLILWGEADPWEPLALGRTYADYAAVEDFIVLPGLGHCPHDEAPTVVNPLLSAWLARHRDH